MNNAVIDHIRLEANSKLDPERKSQLGQFMTPSHIAEFMASLFTNPLKRAHLLDAGAGVGSLAISAIKILKNLRFIDAWEIDPMLQSYLGKNLSKFKVPYLIHDSDFIQDAVMHLNKGIGSKFTHVILNPPYKKINSNSLYRHLLREVGIETVNLYTAFVALSILLAVKGAEIVAIIPRSFCNGPYYKPFREFLLNKCSIDHIHIFESRNKAFGDDEVLQENVILKLSKGIRQKSVTISSSHDAKFIDYKERIVLFSDIIKPNDNELFIHIPTNTDTKTVAGLFSHSLHELSLEVCTGPVVDFRLKEHWLNEPSKSSIPIIYPHHFSQGKFEYPKHHKKPNALRFSPEINKWLMPNGFYVVVKRFSAKEEKKRIVAYILDPHDIQSKSIGFENHWNVFHVGKAGLTEEIAKGLACVLNSTQLDQYFRVFSGHTQVNATDLRNMKYPNLSKLSRLGKQYTSSLTQKQIDSLVDGLA